MIKVTIDFPYSIFEMREFLKTFTNPYDKAHVTVESESMMVMSQLTRRLIHLEAHCEPDKTHLTEMEEDYMLMWALINIIGKLEKRGMKVEGLRELEKGCHDKNK